MTQQRPPTTAAIRQKGSLAPKRVFCFGDSLTAGTSPPGYENHPYALDLERALGPLGPEEGGGVKISWKGFPGWTSSSLLTDAGFSSVLSAAAEQRTNEAEQAEKPSPPPPPFDLVVVLAGTNDLAYSFESEEIFDSIRGIHEMALVLGCSTIALGIPPSGWQAQSESARALADSVNEKLASWAEAPKPKTRAMTTTTYVPFPIRSFDRSSDLWSPDGLHFSKSGYEFMGTSLAPIVAEILWRADGEENNS
jgi:lysophospholipase L1-like esterase